MVKAWNILQTKYWHWKHCNHPTVY